MKKIVKFIAVASLLVASSSCLKYADYNWVPFTTFDQTSFKVEESATATSLSVPVKVYNAKGGTTVSYDIVEKGAKQGVDYTINGSGTLTFAEGVETQNIEFTIMGQPGTYTGDVSFQIVLKGGTDDVTNGARKTCTVTIVDTDHPLLALFGDYTMKSLQLDEDGQLQYYSWTMSINPYDGDPTKVWLDKLFILQSWYGSYLSDGGGKCYANVSSDMSKISIPVPQDFNTNGQNLFGEDFPFWIYKTDMLDFSTEETEIVFLRQDDGSYVAQSDFGVNSPNYDLSDWLYYGLNAFTTISPDAPTYFKKK